MALTSRWVTPAAAALSAALIVMAAPDRAAAQNAAVPSAPAVPAVELTPEETAWLARQHAKSPGLWLRIAKAASNVKSVSYAEALDVALCYGWIDGQKKPFDDATWLQKFTPRGQRSRWSRINRQKVQRLVESGRMRPPGLEAVARAKARTTFWSSRRSRKPLPMAASCTASSASSSTPSKTPMAAALYPMTI